MSRSIYFCGSIRGGQQDVTLYAEIIEELKKYGPVLTEHVGTQQFDEENNKLSDKEIHDRDLKWLQDCEAVVAEVTQPSLGVGYEIGRAVALNKPILCLFRPASGKCLSAMIRGLSGSKSISVVDYTPPEHIQVIETFLADIK